MASSRGRLAVGVTVVLIAAAAVVAGVVLLMKSQSPARPHSPKLSLNRYPTAAPPVPKHGAYFGARVGPVPDTQIGMISAVSELQNQIGRRLGIVHTYLTWQAPFPTESDQAFLRQGNTLLLSWAGTDTVAIKSGRWDSLIRQRALEIKALHRPIFLEWRWEMDRPNLSGEIHSPADYIAAWDHIHAIFEQEHVTNAAWVWCPRARGFAEGNAAAYYPGNKEVDWVCADAYPGRGPRRSFADIIQPFLTWASRIPKPIMIGEYGVPASYGAYRAAWLRAAERTVRQNPQIKALVYFYSSPAGSVPENSFSLNGDPAAIRVFRAIANSSYFQPKGLPASG